MNTTFNPFITSGYKGSKYFCDRKEESRLLRKHIQNNIHTTLFSIRRLGKTELIKHVFAGLAKSKVLGLYVDILGTNNLQEFTNALATAIYRAFPQKTTVGNKIIQALLLLRPVISYEPLTGHPSVSITTADTAEQQKTLYQLFTFLDKQGVKIALAIDEFQQILAYPEKNTEALLRTYMQEIQNITFIFLGSNRQMMYEIFNNAKRPFFASCTNMQLNTIAGKEYKKFIVRHFNENKREISEDALDFIGAWTCLHTFYTQYLCNALYADNTARIDINTVRYKAKAILQLYEPTFYQYRNLLTGTQWQLLTAIAKEEKLYKPTAKKFVNSCRLMPSVIKRSMDALLKKEIIYHNTAIEKPYYQIYDKFLMRWIQTKQ